MNGRLKTLQADNEHLFFKVNETYKERKQNDYGEEDKTPSLNEKRITC